ncbi:putative non-specific serine/threonine protein kinase [Helianthus anomalus]
MSPELRKDVTVVFRATLNSQGNFVLYSHRFRNLFTNSTSMMDWEALRDPCKVNGICGANSYCYTTAGKAECQCFPGFLFFNSSRNGKSLGCYSNFTEEACSQGGLELSHNITALDNMEAGVFLSSMMNLSKEACINSCLGDCNCWVGLYANDSCMLLKVPIIYSVLDKCILATVFIKTSFPKVKDQLHKPLPALKSPEQGALAERRKLVSILAITLGFFALMCTLMAFSSFFYYRVCARRYQRMSQNVGVAPVRSRPQGEDTPVHEKTHQRSFWATIRIRAKGSLETEKNDGGSGDRMREKGKSVGAGFGDRRVNGG